jgi:hypothetical protein
MHVQVMLPTEPSDVGGPVVIRVVHLGLFTADLAWLASELAALEVDVGVAAGVGLASLLGGQWMGLPPLAHVGGVTGTAVAAGAIVLLLAA